MLTPCPFHSGFGGVQLSARLAWDGIAAEFGDRARMIGFGPGCSSSGSLSCSSSRARILLASVRWRFETGAVLCWHVGLLKSAPLLARQGVPVALFLHGVEVWRQPEWLQRKLFERVTHYFTNSDFTWARFLHYYPAAKSKPHTTVALGLAAPEIKAALPAGAPAALMLGRVVSSENYKGHAETIDAWPLVHQILPAAELWIAGGGDALDSLKQQAARLGMGPSIRFFGEISETEKARLLASCSALVLPSRGEGFGLVYLEAMRLGKACLVSTLDAGREVVQPPEAGLAVDPLNRSELADALVRLLSPGAESAAMGERAGRRYDAHFTARHFQTRLVRALAGSGVWS